MTRIEYTDSIFPVLTPLLSKQLHSMTICLRSLPSSKWFIYSVSGLIDQGVCSSTLC